MRQPRRQLLRQLLLPTFALLLLALLPLRPGAAQAGVAPSPDGLPSLDRLMTPDELAATGVERLNEQERAALLTWFADQAFAAHSATTADSERFPLGSYVNRCGTDIPSTLAITDTRGDGSSVELQDGTLWVVKPEDRPATWTWQSGESVVVRRVPAPNAPYYFLLINATAGQRAEAEFAGRAEDPTGVEDPAEE